MTKKEKKIKRKVYDKNYYIAQAMLRDPWLKEKISWLKNRFKEVECPIPNHGFKTYAQYQKWNDKYWNTYSKMCKNPILIAKEKEIMGGRERIPLEEYVVLENFRENFLPPVYGQNFGEILEHFNISKDDRNFSDFLEFYVFLGRTEYPTTLLNVRFIRNQKNDQMELFIQIFGHTKKEDIVNNWDFISRDQKYLPDYLGKSKEWEEFERDLEIYNIYKKIQKEEITKPGETSMDTEIYVQIHKKYKSLTINQIRNIISKSKKRLVE